MGTPFMPWQQHVADVALELDPATGRFVYREVGLTVPRQSGKTTLLLSVIFARALAERHQNIRYTAQTGADARKKLIDDWLPAVESSPFHKRGLFKVRLTNGHEALKFRNGSHVGLIATTKKAGHGGSIDVGILDEAFAHPDARLEQALRPAMITRNYPGSQLWVVSTAGTPEDSPYLWDKVEKYRQVVTAGLLHSVCYFEWSAEDGLDPEDPETWWSCMPALGHTQTVEAVQAEFQGMALNEFERAYLNRWKTATSDPVILLAKWNALADEQSAMQDPLCFAFDVTPDQAWAAIAAAGRRSDGLLHAEVMEQGRGTGWIAPWLAQRVEKHRPIAVVGDPAGTAGAVIPHLTAEGVEVTTVSAREHAQACGLLFDTVEQEGLRHLGQPEVLAALDGAVKRPLADAWAWSRRNSAVDISPLVAITLALWGYQTLSEQHGTPEAISLDDVYERMKREGKI
jgi:phage terminase large subunit-like protein